MAEGILVVDERGRIIMINEAIQKLFSLSTEVVDKTPLEVIRNSELEGTIQEAIRDEKIHPLNSLSHPPWGRSSKSMW